METAARRGAFVCTPGGRTSPRSRGSTVNALLRVVWRGEVTELGVPCAEAGRRLGYFAPGREGHHRHVAPVRQTAGLVLDGTLPIERLTDQPITHVANGAKQPDARGPRWGPSEWPQVSGSPRSTHPAPHGPTSRSYIGNRARGVYTTAYAGPMSVVPPLFNDAETDHPAIAQWCSTILAGDTARLLLMGPHWSGKSHAAYAGLRRLLSAGYGEENITVHQAYDLRSSYEPGVIEGTTAVTVIDDLTLSVDLVREAKVPLRPDAADVQAMMALEAGALADAVERLSLLPRRSWLLVASSIDCLVETVGQETADRLVAVAEQAELEPRPRPTLRW